jgi:hypothetical protein
MGHAPVVPPGENAGGLMLTGGAASPLWQALMKHHADLYLCGEVHTPHCTQANGILQIAHGESMGHDPKLNYLVASVSANGIELELKEIAVTNEGGRVTITDDARKQGFATVGKATLSASVLKDATGCFTSVKETKP